MNTNALTKSDLQTLSKILEKEISYLEFDIARNKNVIQKFYTACDPNNPNTIAAFNALNFNKNINRDSCTKKNKLAEIQRKIKRQLGAS